MTTTTLVPSGRLAVALGLSLAAGCYSGVSASVDSDPSGSGSTGASGGSEGGDDSSTGDAPTPADADTVPYAGLRRLTAAEHDATLRDLIGDPMDDSVLFLPEDARTPFDNDYTIQTPAPSLISGAFLLASDAAQRVVEDPVRMREVVGCEPTGPDDEACFRSFVTRFGRRAFRRPLTASEVDAHVELLEFAVERDDFAEGVRSVLQSMFTSPSFLYRVELGTPVPDQPGVFQLDDYELATRLSYFLWGSTPSDDLLDRAEAGQLHRPSDLTDAVQDMLQDARAIDRATRFHELWLGYEQLPGDYDLVLAMQQENRALMQRVLFDEQRPWQDLLRLNEAFVGDDLAAHYGIPSPQSDVPVWTSYGDTGRKGLLSSGSFLSIGQKFGDTSPTQRGLLIRTRLLCIDVPPPAPDLNVDVDEPPGDPLTQCKYDRYAAHREEGSSCKSCHELFDPIGFGLEAYGPLGELRDHEPGRPECEIFAEGSVTEVGDFSGPGELADMVLQTGTINRCVHTQLYRFAMGRYELDPIDEALLDLLGEQLGEGDFRYDALIETLVTSPGFVYRRTKEVE